MYMDERKTVTTRWKGGGGREEGMDETEMLKLEIGHGKITTRCRSLNKLLPDLNPLQG